MVLTLSPWGSATRLLRELEFVDCARTREDGFFLVENVLRAALGGREGEGQ